MNLDTRISRVPKSNTNWRHDRRKSNRGKRWCKATTKALGLMPATFRELNPTPGNGVLHTQCGARRPGRRSGGTPLPPRGRKAGHRGSGSGGAQNVFGGMRGNPPWFVRCGRWMSGVGEWGRLPRLLIQGRDGFETPPRLPPSPSWRRPRCGGPLAGGLPSPAVWALRGPSGRGVRPGSSVEWALASRAWRGSGHLPPPPTQSSFPGAHGVCLWVLEGTVPFGGKKTQQMDN